MTQRQAALASSHLFAPPRARLLAVAAAALLAACGGGGGGGGGGFFPLPGNGGSAPPPPAAPPAVQALNTLQGSTKDVAIEFHEGTNISASPSPDGKQLVFAAQAALWVMPIEGGKATRITGWQTEAYQPVWSPDGSTIAFQNFDADGAFHIWTIKPNGADLTRITDGLFYDRDPAWTPDGKSLVFSSDRSQDNQTKIWRVDVASRQYAALTQGAGVESYPAVSPDGKQLAYVSGGSIYTKPFGSTDAPKKIGPGAVPAWLPDSSGLAFQRTAATPTRVTNQASPFGVGTYAEFGTTLVVKDKEVVAKEDIFTFPVRWLPDGRFLYTADGKIKIRNADGSKPVEVPFSGTIEVRRPVFTKTRDRGFNNLGEQPVRGISSPVISPDGKSVAFTALNDIWVMRIGEKPVRLTNDKELDGHPQFTADGNAVYFSTEKGNSGVLAVDKIDIASGLRTRLGKLAARSMMAPKMSPAGDRFAYTTDGGTLAVWDIAGQTEQKIISPVGSQVSAPHWTPDGKKLMVVDGEPGSLQASFFDFWALNKLRFVDVGSKTATFTTVAEAPKQISDREEGAAALSPDGSKVAFIMDSLLYVMPLKPDGSSAGAAQAITKEAADLPSWAGDSRTILYKAADKLKTINADGSGGTEVAVNLTWKQAVSSGTTVVRAGQLWSGKDGNLQNDVDIIIKGNRITAIQPHDDAVARAADKFVDASGLTVLPGLWDGHVHPLSMYSGGQNGLVSATLLAYGITSTQSTGGPLHLGAQWREALEAGNMLGPRLFIAPPMWDGTRKHWVFSRPVRTPEIADLEIAKAKAVGVDFIKTYQGTPIAVMHKVAQAALDIGIPSGTHNVSPSVAVGMAGTSHLGGPPRSTNWVQSAGGVVYQDAVDLYGKSGAHAPWTSFNSPWLVGADPALTTDERFKLLTLPNYMGAMKATPAPNEDAMAILRQDAATLVKVQNAGTVMGVGTDTPLTAPGVAVHVHMRAMALGSSNVQALQNATINAARLSLVDKDLGTVEVGKLADLTIVRGNPLSDLKAAANVEYVVKNGVSYSLDQILAPFRTPVALAQRRKTLLAYERMCKTDAAACGELAAGHGHHGHRH